MANEPDDVKRLYAVRLAYPWSESEQVVIVSGRDVLDADRLAADGLQQGGSSVLVEAVAPVDPAAYQRLIDDAFGAAPPRPRLAWLPKEKRTG